MTQSTSLSEIIELKEKIILNGLLSIYKISISVRNLYRDSPRKKTFYDECSNMFFFEFYDSLQKFANFLYCLEISKIENLNIKELEEQSNQLENFIDFSVSSFEKRNFHMEIFSENQIIYKNYLQETKTNLKKLIDILSKTDIKNEVKMSEENFSEKKENVKRYYPIQRDKTNTISENDHNEFSATAKTAQINPIVKQNNIQVEKTTNFEKKQESLTHLRQQTFNKQKETEPIESIKIELDDSGDEN